MRLRRQRGLLPDRTGRQWLRDGRHAAGLKLPSRPSDSRVNSVKDFEGLRCRAVLCSIPFAFPDSCAMNTPPDPLDPLLDRWSVNSEPSPRLAAEVWQRIAVTEAAPDKTTGWWGLVEAWFARPPFAVMFIACCALLGLFLAEVRVNHLQRARSEQLARSYLQLIDPLLTTPNEERHT